MMCFLTCLMIILWHDDANCIVSEFENKMNSLYVGLLYMVYNTHNLFGNSF